MSITFPKRLYLTFAGAALAACFPGFATAAEGAHLQNFTTHWAGWLAIGIFCLAYAFVIAEETIHMRKSKPTMVAAGIIWVIVALLYSSVGDTHTAEYAVKHNLEEFGELFLFLLAAMTYINTMDERGVFDALRSWLVSRGFSLRTIFWVTGLLAFFISPVADNLTTALLMATVVMAVGGSNHAFVVPVSTLLSRPTPAAPSARLAISPH
jgi:Na+/H+ antiporter NhaD/arsenite permease-like protein